VNRKQIGPLLFLLGLFFLQSCANVSTLQTGRTLKAGEGRIIIGAGYYKSPGLNSTLSGVADTEDLKMPYYEIGYNRGLFDSFDMMLKISGTGTVNIGGKYNLIDASSFALALGVEYGMVSITDKNDTSKKTEIKDLMVPLIVSYDFSKGFTLYLAGKFVSRSTTFGSTSGKTTLKGASAGLKMGDGTGIMIEANYLKDDNSAFDVLQTNIGFFF
jgi:predicted porin